MTMSNYPVTIWIDMLPEIQSILVVTKLITVNTPSRQLSSTRLQTQLKFHLKNTSRVLTRQED